MITAKNYASQAIKSLSKFIDNEKSKIYDKDYKSSLEMISNINNSVHFALPDTGKIFDDNFKGLKNCTINLPFPVITVEFFMPSDYHGDEEKILVIARQDAPDTDILISSISLCEKDFWMPEPYSVTIPFDLHIGNPFEKVISNTLIFPEVKKLIDMSKTDLFNRISYCECSIQELLEALSCKNVDQSIHQPASKKNESRIKNGKLPIYETRFLTIKATHCKGKSNKNVIKGSHSSPRQHLRRGHIRRLETGNIWVNSCVVGDSSKGFIDKQYLVDV